MQDEILNPVLSTDTVAVPRYDILGSDGSVLQQNVELRLKNTTVQDGTPYNKESVLPDSLCTDLGISATSTPAGAFRSLLNKINQIISSYRTAAAQDNIDAKKVDKVPGKGLSTNDFTNGYLKTVVDNEAAVAEIPGIKSDISSLESSVLNLKTVSDVTLAVNSSRLTNFSYTAKYIKLLNAVMVRIYGTVNIDMNTTDDYDLVNISTTSRRPDSNSALAVKCAKNVQAIAKSSGVISVRAMESGVKNFDIYISGFWFV